jgi:hypothetical protein
MDRMAAIALQSTQDSGLSLPFRNCLGSFDRSLGSHVNYHSSSGAPAHDVPECCVQIGGVNRRPQQYDDS